MATRINRYLESVSAFDNLEIDLINSSEAPLRNSSGDLTDLIESIRQHGLLQPILVRPLGEKFEVVAGNRRFEACKRLKHRKIKSVVIDLDDKAAYEVAITENVQRKTLSPLEEGLAFKRYCEEFGWGSETELAKKIGKSQEYVSHRIKLLTLPEEVKDALREKRIAVASAEELMWIKEDEAKRKIAGLISTKKLTMHEVRHLVRTMNSVTGLSSLEAQNTLSMEHDNGLFSTPLYTKENDPKAEFSKLTSELILILRIALIRIDDLAEKAKDPKLRELIVSRRIEIHGIIDELISTRKHGMPILPQLVEVKTRRKLVKIN
jgi:ParB family transcriptional regulator, chromosome partitioning protein